MMTDWWDSIDFNKPWNDVHHCVVYRATNLVNDKCYIGVTNRGLKLRKQEHFAAARCAKRKGRSLFHNAIRKHGPNKFSFTVIDICENPDAAYRLERHLIDLWCPVYNLTSGGEGNSGLKMSAETKARMSAVRKGRKVTDEQLAKLHEYRKRALLKRSKGVECVTDSMKFESLRAAEKFYKMNSKTIADSCQGKCNRRGLVFRFLGN